MAADNVLYRPAGPHPTLTPSDPKAFRKQVAYVMQEDALAATATAREAILFSARLRLNGASLAECENLTTVMLDELGLKSCADVLIGGELIKGISGGQRKRTSIGVELVTNPSLVFLDEPTSGLDADAAKNCVEMMKKVSIHLVPILRYHCLLTFRRSR